MASHVKSKRKTLRHKYKVERKVREHHRQVRKEARKNKRDNAISKKRLKKDPGIPNMWPYKQELLESIEQKRAAAEEARKAAIQARRDAKAAGSSSAAGNMSLADFSANAAKRTANFDGEEFDTEAQQDGDLSRGKRVNAENDQSRRAFMREFRRVVDAADVILEVLDARDPIGCRCRDAERAVIASTGGTKRIVLVLNKVDLVPKAVADKWLAYLRNEFPTVAFRASTQSRGTVGHAAMSALASSDVNVSECLGAGNLLSLLKNYTRNRKLKTAITVGVIGFPNVGKSSLINSLKRSRAVSTGATPGVTTSAQEVRLDKNISLIDCPGIVFSDSNADALVLRNCIKIEQLADPVAPVETIIRRVGAEPLMVAYSLPMFNTTAEFLALLCKMRGKFRRGGAFDVEAAARIVLMDWNSGKIPFYTLPPAGPQAAQLSAAVVNSWGQEFDIEKVVAMEGEEMASLKMDNEMRASFAAANPLGEKEGGDATMAAAPSGAKDEVRPSYHVAKKKRAARLPKNAMEL